MLHFLPDAYAIFPFLHPFLTAVLWLFVGVTLLQFYGYLGIFARFAFWKNTTVPAPDLPLPKTSVVVCARNEAENLRQNLPVLLEQKFPDTFEVLVVDDDSTDETSPLLSNFQQKYPHLRVFRRIGKNRAGKKDALTDGISVARFENIVLTDADCCPVGPNWLEKMVRCLETSPGTEIALGYGPYRRDDSTGWLNRWIRFEAAHTALQYFGFTLAGMPYMGVGRNIGWKKRLFGKVGGFESHAHIPSGDDDLFVNAVAKKDNTAICIDPSAFVFSDGKSTWADYYHQKVRHFSTGKHYKKRHQLCLGLCALTHALHYACLAILLFFGFSVGLALLFYALRMGAMFYVYAPTFRQLRETGLLASLPLLDMGLAVFYAVLFPAMLLPSGQVSWRG